jgi:cation:H+ antiporter
MIDLIFNTLGGNIFLIAASFALLYFGADYLVKGSVTIAKSFGVQKLIVGLTVVAFGTSMPEFSVSLFAKLRNAVSISVGNVVGSNIANIALILGVASLIKPLKVNVSVIKLELPILFGITLIFNLLCLDGIISVFDSVILLVIFVSYMAFRIFRGKKGDDEAIEDVQGIKAGKGASIILVVIGIAMLVGGSDLLIRASVYIAKLAGISELVIGLTMVAVGTSLPELFTSAVASIRGESDISIGNVVGSNIFNIFFILGFIGLFGNLAIDSNVSMFLNWLNLGLTALLLPVMITGLKITRYEGAFFLLIYVLFTFNMFYKWISF